MNKDYNGFDEIYDYYHYLGRIEAEFETIKPFYNKMFLRLHKWYSYKQRIEHYPNISRRYITPRFVIDSYISNMKRKTRIYMGGEIVYE